MTVSAIRIRWLAVLTVLAIAVVLNACSNPAPTPEPTATPPATSNAGADCYADTDARTNADAPGYSTSRHSNAGADCYADTDARTNAGTPRLLRPPLQRWSRLLRRHHRRCYANTDARTNADTGAYSRSSGGSAHGDRRQTDGRSLVHVDRHRTEPGRRVFGAHDIAFLPLHRLDHHVR